MDFFDIIVKNKDSSIEEIERNLKENKDFLNDKFSILNLKEIEKRENKEIFLFKLKEILNSIIEKEIKQKKVNFYTEELMPLAAIALMVTEKKSLFSILGEKVLELHSSRYKQLLLLDAFYSKNEKQFEEFIKKYFDKIDSFWLYALYFFSKIDETLLKRYIKPEPFRSIDALKKIIEAIYKNFSFIKDDFNYTDDDFKNKLNIYSAGTKITFIKESEIFKEYSDMKKMVYEAKTLKDLKRTVQIFIYYDFFLFIFKENKLINKVLFLIKENFEEFMKNYDEYRNFALSLIRLGEEIEDIEFLFFLLFSTYDNSGSQYIFLKSFEKKNKICFFDKPIEEINEEKIKEYFLKYYNLIKENKNIIRNTFYSNKKEINEHIDIANELFNTKKKLIAKIFIDYFILESSLNSFEKKHFKKSSLPKKNILEKRIQFTIELAKEDFNFIKKYENFFHNEIKEILFRSIKKSAQQEIESYLVDNFLIDYFGTNQINQLFPAILWNMQSKVIHALKQMPSEEGFKNYIKGLPFKKDLIKRMKGKISLKEIALFVPFLIKENNFFIAPQVCKNYDEFLASFILNGKLCSIKEET